MIFENAYITTAGQEFLTRAVAGTKIRWDKCGCYKQNINSATQEQINALTDLEDPVALGSASAVFESTSGGLIHGSPILDGQSSRSGVAKISCQVDNSVQGVTAGPANSFGLWAKLENAQGQVDQTPTLVVVARVGSYSPTVFPSYQDATSRLLGIIDLSVTVQSGAASTITIAQSGYALAANLQAEIDARELLEESVVKTYGDQDISGNKKFQNKIEVAANIKCEDLIECERLVVYGLENTDMAFDLSGDYMNGESIMRTRYPLNIYQDEDEMPIATFNSEVIEFNRPLRFGGYDSYIDGALLVNGILTASSLETPVTLAATIGTEETPFQDVYANNFHGRMPNPGFTAGQSTRYDVPRIPIGAIVMACLFGDFKVDQQDEIFIGQIIYSSGGTLLSGTPYTSIGLADFGVKTSNNIYMTHESAGNQTPKTIPSGQTFVVLGGGTMSISESYFLPCLLMRIY